MTRFGSDISVGRPTGSCAATGEPLSPGDSYMATLCERDADDGFDRVDVSMAAWEAGHRPERLFSYWKTHVPRPDEKRTPFVDDDMLVDLFERLADDQRPQRRAFRFVIALVLMRKRILRYVGRVGEGEDERWQFTVKGKQANAPGGAGEPMPPIEVWNPHLTDDDVRSLTDQLGEILQAEL